MYNLLSNDMLQALRMHYFISSSVISVVSSLQKRKLFLQFLVHHLQHFQLCIFSIDFFSSEFIIPETGSSLREVFIMKVALKSVS